MDGVHVPIGETSRQPKSTKKGIICYLQLVEPKAAAHYNNHINHIIHTNGGSLSRVSEL